MFPLTLIVVKCDGEESTRNLQKSEEGRREEDTIHLSLIAHLILKLNRQIMIVILIQIHLHHLILVLQVMTGVDGERKPLRGTNTSVANVEEIEGVIRGVGGVIRDQGASQNGCYMFFFPFSLFTF